MYVRPHSKHRENLQINPQSWLEWNVSRWDCSPGQSFPVLRLPITLSSHTQTHAPHAHNLNREGERKKKTKVVRTDKCVVMFMSLKKPVAFPDDPRQVCVCSFQPSVRLSPSLSSPFCTYILRLSLAYVVAGEEGWGLGTVRTGAKKFEQSQENIWGLFRILFCD